MKKNSLSSYGGMNRIGNMLSGLASRVVSAEQLQKVYRRLTKKSNYRL